MTDEMINLQALLEKSSDSDLLREMVGLVAHRLMELEVEGLTGAGHGERSTGPLAWSIWRRRHQLRAAIAHYRRHKTQL